MITPQIKQWYIDNMGWEWYSNLKDFLHSADMENIRKTIVNFRKEYQVYPSQEDIFKAFKLCPFNEVNVVIIGQDPYHTVGVADGLAFSTRSSITPPSLNNIFKELKDDTGIDRLVNKENSLEDWAKQGVFLINTAFSVVKSNPGIHAKLWSPFTEAVLTSLTNKTGVIYVLWGKHASAYKSLIDSNNNFIIEASHPSPFSCNKGFFGSKPFSKINNIISNTVGPEYKIKW